MATPAHQRHAAFASSSSSGAPTRFVFVKSGDSLRAKGQRRETNRQLPPTEASRPQAAGRGVTLPPRAAAAGKQTGQASAASSSFESGLLPRQQANCVEREADEQEEKRGASPPPFCALPSSESRDTHEGSSRSRKRFRCLGARREESFDSAVAEASDESTTERDKSVLLVAPLQAEEEPQQKRPCTLVACKAHAGRVCDGVFFTRLADAVEARRSKVSESSSGADATH
ncbi:hypothetical protein Emed_002441 [Eimeria media]